MSERVCTSPRLWRVWLTCFVAFALLYLLTSQRTVSWQDSGMFQWRVLNGDVEGDLGLALSHPLYILAGKACRLLPDRLFAWGLNFFSGLGMAVALANLAAATTLLTGKRWAGMAAAGMLGVTHTAWWLSTIAEVYTWSAAGLTGELWLLASLLRAPRAWKLTALAGLSGLGLCVHNFALLPLPVYIVVAVVLCAKRLLRWPAMALAACAWIAGAGLYIGMTINTAGAGDAAAAVGSALFGKGYADAVLSTHTTKWGYLKTNAALMAMNFVSFLLPLAIVGWRRFRRSLGGLPAVALAAITIIELAFVLRYFVPDQFTFMLPSLTMIALAAGVGAARLADMSPRWRIAAFAACALSVAIPPTFYAAAPSLARSAGVRIVERHPGRDEIRYWLTPWKQNENSARQFAALALQTAGPDGVILTDSTSVHPLLLVQRLDKAGLGVSIAGAGSPKSSLDPTTNPEAFRRALQGRPLYLVPPARDSAGPALLESIETSGRAGDGMLLEAKWKTPIPPAGDKIFPD